jgi:hypothetical protein
VIELNFPEDPLNSGTWKENKREPNVKPRSYRILYKCPYA